MKEGAIVVVGAGYDLRSATALTMGFVRPDGSIFYVKSPLVSVGQHDLPTQNAFLPAFTYAQYTVQVGDLPTLGVYTVHLYDFGPEKHPTRLSSSFFLR